MYVYGLVVYKTGLYDLRGMKSSYIQEDCVIQEMYILVSRKRCVLSEKHVALDKRFESR